ncbi:MAG: hypothetical protein KJP23_10940 [Deltaproteobacteria bacterium]|nr:hypothetical protein [Deltaproteobacteria bacterium]
MKKSSTTALGALTGFLSGLMIGACATAQIDTELPANHPANPVAEATVFVPPPNPFAMNASDVQPVWPLDSIGDHPKHGDHQKHREDAEHGHGMQTIKPQSAAPASSTEKSTEHQH